MNSQNFEKLHCGLKEKFFPGDVVNAVYNRLTTKIIKNVDVSCGCMNYTYNNETFVVSVEAKPLPANRSSFVQSGFAKITYVDDTQETLTFSFSVYQE